MGIDYRVVTGYGFASTNPLPEGYEDHELWYDGEVDKMLELDGHFGLTADILPGRSMWYVLVRDTKSSFNPKYETDFYSQRDQVSQYRHQHLVAAAQALGVHEDEIGWLTLVDAR